jgi:hypothetical protein
VKIQPYYPGPLTPPNRRQEGVGPVESKPPVPDAIQGQRALARRLAVPEAERRAAADLLGDYRGVSAKVEEDPAGRRAIAAYESVAKSQERDYVSSILGISEYA